MSDARRTGLEDVFASAAGDEPSDAQLARLEAQLAPLLGGPPAGPSGGEGAGGAGAAGAAGAGAAAAAAGKGGFGWLVALVTAGGLAGGGALLYRSAAREAPRREVAAVITADAAPAPEAEAAPPAPDAGVIPPRDAGPRVKPTRQQSAAEALAAEARMLERAQTALRDGVPRAALAATARHRDRFPSGQLAEERERLAIEALVALGRRADAEARARRFRAAYPRSVQWTRIRELLDRPQ